MRVQFSSSDLKYLIRDICIAIGRIPLWLSLPVPDGQPAPAMRGTYQTWKNRLFRQTCPDAGRVLHQSLRFSARTILQCKEGMQQTDVAVDIRHLDCAGLDTKVSLKQALSALGFKGGIRREMELNQRVVYEKKGSLPLLC